MKSYQEKKEQARKEAVEWSNTFKYKNYSYGELIVYEEYFYRLAKRYGLVREFRENGIL